MPKFLEEKLKKEYGDNKRAIYGTMNKLGYMRGNRETKKGKIAEKKHIMGKKVSVGEKMHHSLDKINEGVNKLKKM